MEEKRQHAGPDIDELFKGLTDTFDFDAISRLIDALPFYVLLVDEEHRIVLANRAVSVQYGQSIEDLIGGYCPAVIHGAKGPIPQCPLEESVRSGSAVEREYFDPGCERWVSSAIYPTSFRTENGKKVYLHMVHDITERKLAEEDAAKSVQNLHDLLQAGIRAMTVIVEKRDPYTAGHQTNVSVLACGLAEEMGISKEELEGIRIMGLLHDVGKIAVPIEILSKPGRITKDEMNIIRTHPEVGYNILKDIDFPWPVSKAVLQHHERMDGSGYPSGLAGDEILLESRILAVADVVEAMCSHRPYRPALGVEKALEEINRNKGVLYDRAVVEACCRLFREKKFTFKPNIGQ